jgi:predicted transposase YbfD/YdcC
MNICNQFNKLKILNILNLIISNSTLTCNMGQQTTWQHEDQNGLMLPSQTLR